MDNDNFSYENMNYEGMDYRNMGFNMPNDGPTSVFNGYKPPEYSGKKAFSKVGFGLAGYAVCFNLIVFLAQLIYLFAAKPESISITLVIAFNFVAQVVFALPLYCFIIKDVPKVSLEKKSMGIGSFLGCVCIMYAISITGSIISTFINGLLADAVGMTSDSNITLMFNDNFAVTAMYSVIVAPIIEELVFRKLLIDRVQGYSRKYAMILSGLAFGLMHGNLEQFFFAFFIGIFFSFIYLRTGNVIYTIAFHFIMNGMSTVLQFCLSKLTILDRLGELSAEQIADILMKDTTMMLCLLVMVLVTMLTYLFAISGLCLLIAKRRRFTLESPGNYISAKEAFLNPGVIAAFVVMLGLLVLNFFM